VTGVNLSIGGLAGGKAFKSRGEDEVYGVVTSDCKGGLETQRGEGRQTHTFTDYHHGGIRKDLDSMLVDQVSDPVEVGRGRRWAWGVVTAGGVVVVGVDLGSVSRRGFSFV
jgi:hypothetical protein